MSGRFDAFPHRAGYCHTCPVNDPEVRQQVHSIGAKCAIVKWACDYCGKSGFQSESMISREVLVFHTQPDGTIR